MAGRTLLSLHPIARVNLGLLLLECFAGLSFFGLTGPVGPAGSPLLPSRPIALTITVFGGYLLLAFSAAMSVAGAILSLRRGAAIFWADLFGLPIALPVLCWELGLLHHFYGLMSTTAFAAICIGIGILLIRTPRWLSWRGIPLAMLLTASAFVGRTEGWFIVVPLCAVTLIASVYSVRARRQAIP